MGARQHDNEFSGPVAVSIMMKHADLKDRSKTPDEIVAWCPLAFSDLTSYDAANYYQDLQDAYRQNGTGTHVVYCRRTVASGHAFLQYYHFEPSSSIPDTLTFWHEGDWEMFQIAVKLDTTEQQLTPIAVTGAQHYYGQTIRWTSQGNGPASQDQDYVGKIGNRPQVYVAREAHATYFRSGYFRTRTGNANHGDQYQDAPTLLHADDETGQQPHSYSLSTFSNSMISQWKGLWGADLVVYGDGPPSPAYKSTAVNVWANPKSFNNYYRKLDNYPNGNPAHSETYIP